MVFTSTVDYRRNVYVAACPQRPVAARVNPDFGTLGECVRGSGYRLAWSLRWTDRRKTGIVSDSQRPCLHCFVYGTRCPRSYAPVAQWIEYCPPKAGVAGSIPAGRTRIRKCCWVINPEKSRPYGESQGPFFISRVARTSLHAPFGGEGAELRIAQTQQEPLNVWSRNGRNLETRQVLAC